MNTDIVIRPICPTPKAMHQALELPHNQHPAETKNIE